MTIMAETRNGLSTEFISHPGETLLELLEQYGVSQKELSIKTQTSEKHINEIIKGKKDISVAFAKKLENVFKPSASFWINRQNIYDEKIETIRIIENISKEEKQALKQFPISELVELGYLKDERNKQLYKALDGLKPEYREILWLTFFEDMNAEQTAKVLHKSKAAVYTLLNRAKSSLKEKLEKEGFDYEVV